MKKIQYFIGITFFIALSLPCSYFFHLRQQAPEFTIQSHSLRISVLSFIGSSVIIFFLLLGLWLLYSKLVSKLFQVSYPKVLWQDLWSWLPLAFLGLSPLALSHYFTSNDLISRLKLFLLALIAAILYLKLANLYLRWKENPTKLPNLFQKFSLLPLKKKLILLFLIAIAVYNTGSTFILCSNIHFSGDEPHYLLITHSILKDGDFNLANNYAEKDYRQFMLPYVTIKPHIAPNTNGKYSFHSPGVSILLLPFYALGSLFSGKVFYFIIRLGMSIFGALLGIQLFLFAQSEWKNEKLALILWCLFSFTSPAIFYSIHVYPEIIAALFSLAIFRILRFSKSLSPFTLIIIGALLSSMIWFHALKYIFIMGPLFIYSVWSLFKQHKLRWNVFYFFAPSIFLGLAYFFFQFRLYGSFSLSSISWRGAMAFSESMEYLKSIIFDIPLRYRLETLAGYFFDQRDGLLFYSPVYFFAFIGFFQMLKRKPKDFLLLLFITAPYVLNSALLTQRAGYAPQARPLVAVSWGLAIFLGYFLAFNTKKIFSYIFAIAAFLSYLFVVLLIKSPLALYQLTTFGETNRAGELFLQLSNLHFFLPNLLPSYLKIENSHWPPNFIWLGILALLILSYYMVKSHSFPPKLSIHILISSFGLLVFFLWIVLYPRTVIVNPTDANFPTGEKMRFYSIGRVARMVEPGKFTLPEGSRDYIFDFTCWRKIDKLQIEFGSLDGVFYVELYWFDKKLFQGIQQMELQTLSLSPPPCYRLRNTNLYRVRIYLKKISGTLSHTIPYHFSVWSSKKQAQKLQQKKG